MSSHSASTTMVRISLNSLTYYQHFFKFDKILSESYKYRVSTVPDPFTATVEKVDDNKVYRIIFKNGEFKCTCPDFKFRSRKLSVPLCKHIVYALLLKPVPEYIFNLFSIAYPDSARYFVARKID